MYLPVQILRVAHESARAWQSVVCIPIAERLGRVALFIWTFLYMPPPDSNYYSYVSNDSSDSNNGGNSSETTVFYDDYSYDSHSD
ncbi:hypothetical protein ACJRO7_018472 [Eucalyptus globulus]|uniref:HVA22-like protein n=1 Tax=Eucalyptus globulus TaxID=34317 RepID=A0ABD3KV19_EUCGL